MADAVARAAGVPGELARRALMLSGDLPKTAAIAMSGGENGLREVGFEIFQPILPMLASTSTGVAEAVASFECSSVEWKLDGIRIQIHRRGDAVRIYTRNLNDITTALTGIRDAVLRLPATRPYSTERHCGWVTRDPPHFRRPCRESIETHRRRGW